MKKIKMAILGAGPRAQSLIQTYAHHPGVDFTAFCDIADGVSEAVAVNYKAYAKKDVKVYTSYEDMVKNPDFEALLIACDPDIQVDYACDAMKRGIHVMTEVPAAYTIEQCWNLVNTVKATGAKYQLAEQTRYWDFICKWRELAKQGKFGKIIYAEGEYLHYEPMWDYFVNIHTGHHITTNDPSFANNPDYKPSWRYNTFRHPIYYLPHTLSPLLSITGGRISRVSCFGTRSGSYSTEGFDVRDLETAIMYNTNDTIFSVRAGFTSPHGQKSGTGAHWYQVKGTERSVEWCRSTLDEPKMWTTKDGWSNVNWSLEDRNAPDHIKNSPHGGSDWYPIDYFIDAIINDKTPPMDVYKTVETAAPAILAAQSAQNNGIMLEVPDFRA